MISICAVIAGADTWVDIEEFGHDKERWLRRFLELPGGIPSHDTFGRVFSLIDPEQFQGAFVAWMQSVVQLSHGDIIAIDGKTNRRTFGGKTADIDTAGAGVMSALHLVSAFAVTNGVALAQVATDQKSNEITAIPALLNLIDITGCLITTDAMGCQSGIAADIVARGGHYLLAVKGNQGHIDTDIRALFADATVQRITHVSNATGHGRTEQRTCEVISGDVVLERIRHKNNWAQLHTVVRVTSQRTVTTKGVAHTSTESRYYICDLVQPGAAEMQAAVRAHWGIENSLHWVIDMAFREDDSRIRTGHAPANMAGLRHIALNALRSDKTRRIGIKASRLKAARNEDYLARVVGGVI
jgi:predicted transposase YbfD/YdcC